MYSTNIVALKGRCICWPRGPPPTPKPKIDRNILRIVSLLLLLFYEPTVRWRCENVCHKAPTPPSNKRHCHMPGRINGNFIESYNYSKLMFSVRFKYTYRLSLRCPTHACRCTIYTQPPTVFPAIERKSFRHPKKTITRQNCRLHISGPRSNLLSELYILNENGRAHAPECT